MRTQSITLKLMLAIMISLYFILAPNSSSDAEVDDITPVIGLKSSIAALKIGVKQIEQRNNLKLLPQSIPLPLMDMNYFHFGEWAFYAEDYMNDILNPYYSSEVGGIIMKPLSLHSSQSPGIVKSVSSSSALVRVEYPRHKELERLLQKLYFNLMRGPVILSVAYNPDKVQDGYEDFADWNCFRIPDDNNDKDVHLVYVDWNEVQSVVAYLDGSRIKLVDRGKIYDVDHNALVAQANAIKSMPFSELFKNSDKQFNFLLFYDQQHYSTKESKS